MVLVGSAMTHGHTRDVDRTQVKGAKHAKGYEWRFEDNKLKRRRK